MVFNKEEEQSHVVIIKSRHSFAPAVLLRDGCAVAKQQQPDF
jgi:hypothetical protein